MDIEHIAMQKNIALDQKYELIRIALLSTFSKSKYHSNGSRAHRHAKIRIN